MSVPSLKSGHESGWLREAGLEDMVLRRGLSPLSPSLTALGVVDVSPCGGDLICCGLGRSRHQISTWGWTGSSFLSPNLPSGETDEGRHLWPMRILTADQEEAGKEL